MSLEKPFICRYILNTNDFFIEFEFDDSIDEEKRIPMRQNFFERVNIEYDAGFLIGLVFLDKLPLLIELANLLGEFNVACVAGTGGQNLRFDGNTDKSKIANQIEQLMAGGFVLVAQLAVVENPIMADNEPGIDADVCGNPFNLFFRVTLIDNDDCIIKVSTPNQTLFMKSFDLMKETKCPR